MVNNSSIRKNEIPSMKNTYSSNFSKEVDAYTQYKGSKMYQASKNPVNTGVINKNFGLEKDEIMSRKIRSLSGEYIEPKEFKHNNMTPFFGSRIRQNLDDHANNQILESYTGRIDGYKQKCEVKSMYDTSKNIGYVNGAPNLTDNYKDRYVQSRIRTNELPFEQIKVGPGLNQGYGSKPVGGYQQFDVQNYAMPKCVDELRVANKPKETYEGRIIDGTKGSVPGLLGNLTKEKIPTFRELSQDDLFRTNGAFTKPKEIPEFNVKSTNRNETTTEYIGSAVAIDNKKRKLEPFVENSLKPQFREFGFGSADLTQIGKGSSDDYGKSTIQVYANERDLTTTKVHQGNLTSLIKAIVAPLQDIVKTTKKDELVDNPRHFGNLNTQFPSKLPVKDPNDVARTTIKETLIHDEIGTGTLTGARQLYVYDPDEVAKTTLRETLESMDYEMNLRGYNKGKAYDPNDKAKTTLKETTEDGERYGNIDNLERMGDYNTTEYEAKLTHRQFLSDEDYYGIVNKGTADGYKVAEMNPKLTQKQFLSDNDYYGGIASKDKKPISQENINNAHISISKESVIMEREPTQTGAKTFITKDGVKLSHIKPECTNISERYTHNSDKIVNEIPTLTDESLTRMKKEYTNIAKERLDPDLLKAYLENPYTININNL